MLVFCREICFIFCRCLKDIERAAVSRLFLGYCRSMHKTCAKVAQFQEDVDLMKKVKLQHKILDSEGWNMF